MGVGALLEFGGAKEAVWGTGVAPTFYPPVSSEGFKDGPEAISELQLRGILDTDPKYKGMQMVSGAFGGIAYPSQLGHVLRAALGPPVTTGAGPFTHTFVPIQAPFVPASGQALPSYSFTVNRDSIQILRYEGMQCSKLSLKFSQGGALTYDTSWIGRDASVQTAPTVTLPTDTPFTLSANIQRNAVAFADLQDFSLDISNSIEAVKTINNSDKITRISWSGRRTIALSGTADFASLQLYNDFKAFASTPWTIVFTIGASTLTLEFPALLITDESNNVGGDGRITASFSSEARYDTATARAFRAILVNATATY
jgi:Phage tail tube protein